MARVAETYPDDLDAATLYAEALFLLLPRPGAFDIHDPDVSRVLNVLERALKRDIHHVGACHLYVHTTELTSEPQRAEPCVEYLGNAVPGASHLNHMPAHTWTRVGRWGDAVRASLQAWQSDQKAVKGEGVPHLSRARSADARVRGVVRWPKRAGDLRRSWNREAHR